PELAGLLAEIDKDRPGLEDTDRFAARPVGIDDRRYAVVRADLQELGLELLALADIDRMHRVREAHLLERDRDLAAVGRVPGPEFDRHLSGLFMGMRPSLPRSPKA